MLIAHRIALDLNNAQATYMSRAAGTARFAYNWTLSEWKRQYEAWKADNSRPKPGQMSLRRQLNAVKREQFPWMLEVTKNAAQMAIIQLGQAFQNFFAGRARYPQFRRKGVHDRFTLTNDQFAVDGSRIRIPNLGWVRMRETLRFTGKVMSATVSRVAGRWFVSVTLDAHDNSHLPQAENQGAVGVDLGIAALATSRRDRRSPARKPTRLCWSACAGSRAPCRASTRDRPTAARRRRNWRSCMRASPVSAPMRCTSSPRI